ncbi:MAG: DUF440 family protein [Gammaproteobacteria bacterium]|nr:DUF440 family protein [Gammaproteobacteria bacterium]
MAKSSGINTDLLVDIALDIFEENLIDNLDPPDLDYYAEQVETQGAVELVSAFNDWQDQNDLTQEQLEQDYVEVRIGLYEDNDFDLIYARVLLRADQKNAQQPFFVKWKR